MIISRQELTHIKCAECPFSYLDAHTGSVFQRLSWNLLFKSGYSGILSNNKGFLFWWKRYEVYTSTKSNNKNIMRNRIQRLDFSPQWQQCMSAYFKVNCVKKIQLKHLEKLTRGLWGEEERHESVGQSNFHWMLCGINFHHWHRDLK